LAGVRAVLDATDGATGLRVSGERHEANLRSRMPRRWLWLCSGRRTL